LLNLNYPKLLLNYSLSIYNNILLLFNDLILFWHHFHYYFILESYYLIEKTHFYFHCVINAAIHAWKFPHGHGYIFIFETIQCRDNNKCLNISRGTSNTCCHLDSHILAKVLSIFALIVCSGHLSD